MVKRLDVNRLHVERASEGELHLFTRIATMDCRVVISSRGIEAGQGYIIPVLPPAQPYCVRMFATFATFAHFAISTGINLRISSGERGSGSTPSACNRFTMSGCFKKRNDSALILLTMPAAVPAGAATAHQLFAS